MSGFLHVCVVPNTLHSHQEFVGVWGFVGVLVWLQFLNRLCPAGLQIDLTNKRVL